MLDLHHSQISLDSSNLSAHYTPMYLCPSFTSSMQPYKNSNNSSQSLAHISNCKFPLARPLVSSSHPASTNSSTKLLNSMLLFAFLTLQPSYPALAASSDFSTIFGDIGDLSTGFASVRKISLSLFFFFNYNAFKKIIKLNLNYRNGQWNMQFFFTIT